VEAAIAEANDRSSVSSQQDNAAHQYVSLLTRSQLEAFERTMEQGDPRQVAAMCARHAVKLYLDQAANQIQCAKDCAHRFVQKAATKVSGSEEEVAAACARDAVQGYVTKSSGVVELAAGCARVAVARWLQAAEKAKAASEDQGSEREVAASAAHVAVGRWITKATEATSKEGQRKVATACARVAVARFVEKAKLSIEAEGQKEQHFPEAVKRNESKAFERTVEQGDPRQVAAMCARHAVKLYLDQAKEAMRRQGTELVASLAVEQVHSTVFKAATKIAAASQPAIDNLEGLIISEEDGIDPPVSPSGKSPMKPSGTAPKKKRPMPKESKLPASAAFVWDSWTAPPSPEQFEEDIKVSSNVKSSSVRIHCDPEEERKRDVELLQKRHQENLQRVRQAQEELRSEHNRSLLRDFVVSKELPGSKLSRPHLPAKPKPAKSGRQGSRASSRRGYVKSQKRTECSHRSASESPTKAEKEGSLAPVDSSLSATAEMEADVRSDLDDPVLRAYLAVYKSTVCKRGDDVDASTRGAGSTCDEAFPGDVLDKKRRSKSATSRHSTDKKESWLQPGLLSWQDKAKAWFWPRKGAVPPMETAVLALLNGNPPPIEVTAQAAAAARQHFATPALQKTQASSWALTCKDTRSSRS